MITVKLIGGAKKSFLKDQFEINASDITILELFNLLLKLKPNNFPELDPKNILVAINGVDSSAINGQSTIIKNTDLVSIIPVIHGGSSKKLNFEIAKKQIQVIEIKNQKTIDVKFIDELRKKFPKIQLQAISTTFVLNDSHLKKILSLSLESEKNNLLLSNKLETDILMRFALTTQISAAIDTVGIKSYSNFILIAIGNKKILQLLSDDVSLKSVSMFQKNNDLFLRKYFKITKKQLNVIHSKTPLEDILVEKAAILF